MSFNTDVNQFIRSPFPLWETGLTDKLVELKYAELNTIGINDRLSYNTVSVLTSKKSSSEKKILKIYSDKSIYIEKADFKDLGSFYHEHGLIPLTGREMVKQRLATKLKAALNVLSAVPDCINCLASLVNCIQGVAAEGPEYDTSYSHPAIPFTIFVSVCENDDISSNIRVAESILHEAMHLNLSLIQRYTELIKRNDTDTFFSPWRETQRPLLGVLHGLFVFRAILDFYRMISVSSSDNRQLEFFHSRITGIEDDLGKLAQFGSAKGLTTAGSNFVAKLLQY